jgi:flavin-dependent dehydrogenase
MRFDVVIIGAGPAGSAAAYYLACAGAKVLVLDKATFPRDKTCGDGLVPRALPILAEMGILDMLRQQDLGRQLDQLEVSAPSGRTVRFTIPPLPHAPNHAVVIPRLTLDSLLLQKAIASGVDFRGGVHVRGIQADADGVTIASDENYHATLAIVATGANTALLNNLGLNPPKPNIVAARAYFEGIESLPSYFQFPF